MNRLLPLLLLLVSSAVLAESGAYRVEVIIFRNLLVSADATGVDELRSFSRFPDLEESREPAESIEISPDEPAPDLPPQLATVLQNDLPDDVQVVFDRGTYMDDVWRRLRSSEGYRPLAYASWEQNRVDYYPPMRIHDDQTIDSQLRPISNIMIADLAAEDPLSAYRSDFYRLDGSVQLRRSRFLHLFLDLEYREQIFQAEPGETSGYDFLTGAIKDPATGHQYGVHALKQNRQVRTNQMQYFDTPFFGALVFVTSIEAAPAIQ